MDITGSGRNIIFNFFEKKEDLIQAANNKTIQGFTL